MTIMPKKFSKPPKTQTNLENYFTNPMLALAETQRESFVVLFIWKQNRKKLSKLRLSISFKKIYPDLKILTLLKYKTYIQKVVIAIQLMNPPMIALLKIITLLKAQKN